MQLLFGLLIGALIMYLVQFVIEISRHPEPSFPAPLPARFDTLARWGRIRAVRVVTKCVTPALPHRTPGAALALNPVVPVVHVPPGPDWITQQLDWLRCQLPRIAAWFLRPVDRFDPLGDWDMSEWWRGTFYDHVGRHRLPDEQAGRQRTWQISTAAWATIITDFTFSHNRRIRTEDEWARIMEVNERTREVRLAHRTGRPRLRRKEYAGV